MSVDPDPGVARNTLWALLTQLATSAFTAVLTLYLIRTLGPREFGVLSLALGLGGLLMLLADFGISQSAARFIAERRHQAADALDVLASATRLKLAAGAGVAVALFALAGPVARAYGIDDLAWPLRGVALAVFGQSMVFFYSQVFVAVRRVKLNLWLVLAESAVEFGATLSLVILGGGAGGAAFGRAIGYVAGAVFGLMLAVSVFGRGAARLRGGGTGQARLIGRYAGALLVVNGIYTLFSQVDVLLIGAILGPAAVGVFSAPLRLVVLLHYPGLALSNSVAPRVARGGDDRGTATLSAGLRLLLVTQTLIAVPVLVWAAPITELLIGPDYPGSAEVLRAMAPLVFVQGLGPLVSVSVNYLGEARRRVPIAVGALALNLVIDVALLRELGPVAAAYGASAGYVVYVAGHLAICRRLLDLPLRPLLATFARALVAGASLAGVLLVFGTSDLTAVEWVAGLAIGTAAFVATLVLVGETTTTELRRLPALLRR